MRMCHLFVFLLQGFLTAEQSLFIPLLVLVATLAVAGGLPFLLLPSSLLNPHAATADGPADSKPGKSAATAAISSRRRMRSPFSDAAAAGTAATSTGAKGSKHAGSDAAGILPSSASSMLLRLWVCLQQSYAVVCSRAVSVCVKADTALRNACASSLLDTAVSGLIVVGLILGSVVLGAVLLVQVGDESRQVGWVWVGFGCWQQRNGWEDGQVMWHWSTPWQWLHSRFLLACCMLL